MLFRTYRNWLDRELDKIDEDEFKQDEFVRALRLVLVYVGPPAACILTPILGMNLYEHYEPSHMARREAVQVMNENLKATHPLYDFAVISIPGKRDVRLSYGMKINHMAPLYGRQPYSKEDYTVRAGIISMSYDNGKCSLSSQNHTDVRITKQGSSRTEVYTEISQAKDMPEVQILRDAVSLLTPAQKAKVPVLKYCFG